jgi:hypothetical protein
VAGAREPACKRPVRRRSAASPPALSERRPDARILDRNPEGAAPRGLWGDVDFLRNVYDRVNPQARHTQFADYHGHGWNFRAVYKRDREGNLLDAEGGNIVAPDDPEKFRKAGEGRIRPARRPEGQGGPHDGHPCREGHAVRRLPFRQDSHGNGYLYGEVANAVEIGCKDCHGTATAYPNLLTSGPARRPKGTNLALLSNETGKARFEWMETNDGRRVLIQRSIVDPNLEWEVSLVKDTLDPQPPALQPQGGAGEADVEGRRRDRPLHVRPRASPGRAGPQADEMACFTCHLSWTTSCAGCHLPIEANWKTKSHKYDGDRDPQLRHLQPAGRARRHVPARPPPDHQGQYHRAGALDLGAGPVARPTSTASGSTSSSRRSAPPASRARPSRRISRTRCERPRPRPAPTATSRRDDNNAIMAQLLLLGDQFRQLRRPQRLVGLEGGFEAVRVTEWDEPQAVIGSYLQRFAYPDFWRLTSTATSAS